MESLGYYCDQRNRVIQEIEATWGSGLEELSNVEKIYLAYEALGSALLVLDPNKNVTRNKALLECTADIAVGMSNDEKVDFARACMSI